MLSFWVWHWLQCFHHSLKLKCACLFCFLKALSGTLSGNFSFKTLSKRGAENGKFEIPTFSLLTSIRPKIWRPKCHRHTGIALTHQTNGPSRLMSCGQQRWVAGAPPDIFSHGMRSWIILTTGVTVSLSLSRQPLHPGAAGPNLSGFKTLYAKSNATQAGSPLKGVSHGKILLLPPATSPRGEHNVHTTVTATELLYALAGAKPSSWMIIQ